MCPDFLSLLSLLLILHCPTQDRSNAHKSISYGLMGLIASQRVGPPGSPSTPTPSSATSTLSPTRPTASSSSFLPSILLGPPPSEDAEDDEDGDASLPHGRKGLINSDGAWCWREGCEECLRLTRAIQGAAEALEEVSGLEEKHVSGTSCPIV